MSAVAGLEHFLEHTKKLDPANHPQKINGFTREFQELKELTSKLKRDPKYSTSQGEREVNRSKNRYKDILPYDYTRIKLPLIEGLDGSDYINGNYIKGPDGNTMYLAAQGPLPRTVDDFWRLLWSHKIQVIVMVCREYEMGKLKCKRYWPEESSEKLQFAGVNVSLVSKDDMGDGFVVRTLLAKKEEEELVVTQFHYMAWPDHDVPHSAEPLVELIKSFRAFTQGSDTPICIHCSAGCGRTGTICSVDYAWTLIKSRKTEDFNLYEIVAEMRRQRIAMVQTKEQYAFVYKAVVQLIKERMGKSGITGHTYVNVEAARAVANQSPSQSSSPSNSPLVSPIPSPSPTRHETYENFEFINSINRWKGGQCSPHPSRKQEKLLPNGNKKLPRQKSAESDNSFTQVRQKPTSSLNNGSSKLGPSSYVNVVVGSGGKQAAPQTSVTQQNQHDAGNKTRPERKSLPCGGNGDYVIPQLNNQSGGERKFSQGNVPGNRNSGPLPPPPKKDVPEGLLIDFGPTETEQTSQIPVKKSPANQLAGDTRPINYENVLMASKSEAASKSSDSPRSSLSVISSGLYAVPTETQFDTKKELDNAYHIPNKETYQAPSSQPKGSSNSRKGDVSVPNGLCKLDNPPVPTTSIVTAERKNGPTLKTPIGSYCLSTPSASQDQPLALPRSATLKGSPTSEIPPIAASRSLSKATTKPKVKPRAPLQFGNNGMVGNFQGEHQSTAQAKPPLPKRPDSSPEDTNPPSQPVVSSLEDLYASVDKTRKGLKRQASDCSAYSLATVPIIERTISEGNLNQKQAQPPLYSSAQDDSAKGGFKGFMRSSLKEAKESIKNFGQGRSSRESEHPVTDTRTNQHRAEVAADLYASVGPRLASKEKNISSPTYESVSPPPVQNVPSNSFKNGHYDENDEEGQTRPPVPVKTSGAFIPRDTSNAYDYVESQPQSKPGTLERGLDKFRSRAMNILSAVPDKVNLGMPTKRSSDLGSNTTFDASNVADIGYMKRVAKPKGARRQPRGWPSFSPLTTI